MGAYGNYGEIYGIPSYSYEGNGLYYVFNQQYLDKYNVDISQVTGDLQTLYPILTELSEKRKKITKRSCRYILMNI